MHDGPGLSRYVPRTFLSELQARGVAAARPWQRRDQGALLLVDIAGFSGITAGFTKDRPRGAEGLTHLLNAYLQRMSDVLAHQGGDILAFGGDSLVVFWPAGENLRDALLTAARCSMDVHRAAASLTGPDGTAIRQRIAVSAGEFVLSNVGGHAGRWLLLVSGTPIVEAGLAFHDAEPGETLICSSAWRHLSEHCTAERICASGTILQDVVTASRPASLPQPVLEPDLVNLLPAYLPQMLAERISLGQVDWLAEFRWLTVLFVNIRPNNRVDDEPLDALQHLAAAFQAQLDRHEGVLEKLAIDDKGLNMVAAFGLPPRSSGQDASKALRAARRIVDVARQAGVRVAAAAATGPHYVGDVGSDTRRHFSLIGPAVNLAARLASLGVDDIICDAATAEAASASYTFAILPTLTLSGYDQDVRGYRPDQERVGPESGNGTAQVPLVGRQTEAGHLLSIVAAAASGDGGLAVIAGEAGIGKTRLLQDVAGRAEADGLTTLLVRAARAEIAQPLQPWADLLRRVVDHMRADDESDHVVLRGLLATRPQLLASLPLLADIMPLPLEPGEHVRQLAPSARSSTLRRLIVAVLAAAFAQRRFILLIDDLQLLDTPSVLVLKELLRQQPQLLVLASLRTGAPRAASELDEVLQRYNPVRLNLEGLDRAEVTELIGRSLNVSAVRSELADYVFETARGHPLYSEELVLALRSTGQVVTTGGVCRYNPSSPAAPSAVTTQSLRAVVTARVDSLGATEQLMVKAAAVLGTRFSSDTLRRINPTPLEDVAFEQRLGALRELGLFHATGSDEGDDLAFKHPLTQEVIYDLLPTTQSQALHRAALEVLSAGAASSSDELLPVLAYHAERAPAYDTAMALLEQLARRAIGQYANREAVAYLRRAMSIAGAADLDPYQQRFADWQALLGDAHQELPERAEARLAYAHALDGYGHPPPAGPALAAAIVLQLARQLGRRWLGGAGPQQVDRLPVDPRLARIAHIFQRLSETAFFQNEPTQVLHHTLYAVNLAERAHSAPEMMNGYASLAIGLGLAGMPRLARRYSALALQLAGRPGDQPDAGYVHLLTTVFAFGQGDWPLVENCGDAAADCFARAGDSFRYHSVRFVQLYARITAGDIAAASALLAGLGRDPALEDFKQPRLWYRSAELLIGLLSDRLTQDHIRQVTALIDESMDRSDRMLGHGLLAAARMRLGDRKRALSDAEAALAILEARPPTIGGGYIYGAAGPADVFLQLAEDAATPAEQRRSALSAAARACRALEAYAQRVPASRPRVLLLRGRLALARGRRARARRLWRRGLKTARRLAMRHDQSLLLLALAGAAGSDRALQNRLCDEAATILRDIGAAHDLNRIDRLLRAESPVERAPLEAERQ